MTDAAALLERGRHALDVSGDLGAAHLWFGQAHRTAIRDGETRLAAEAALGLGGLWVYERRGAGELARVLSAQREALARIPPDSDLALRLRTRLAAEADYQVGENAWVLAVLDEARRDGDAVTLAAALSLAHHCLLGPAHGPLRSELAQELLLTATRPVDRLVGLLWRTVDLVLDGDPHAERSLAELTEALRQHDHAAIGFVVRALGVMLTIRAGEFDRAEKLAAECAALGDACGDADAPIWRRAQLLAIRWFQGRAGELLPAVLEEAHSPSLGPLDDSQFAALATIAAAEGDHRVAAGALARLGRGDLAQVPSGSAWLVTMYAAVEAAALLGDTETASTAYRLLLPHARRPAVGGLGVVCFGSVEHPLGLAALTFGDTARAVTHLRRAVRDNLALGHWPAACLARHRLGRALTLAGLPDPESAAARREAGQLGMVLPSSGETRVRVLGRVDLVVEGAARPVPGRRRQAVLAVLALHGGAVVSTDRVITAVWGEHPPATALNTLQRHISYLRGVLGHRTEIRAHGGGYALAVGSDATAAEHLVGLGLAAADPAERAGHLETAVRLWRGPALADLSGSAWLAEQADRLGELLVRARHALAAARLDLDRPEQALPDLEELARDHPLHEQVHATLMLALYRAGRQADALAVYRRLRAALRDDLAIEPSRPLRDLEAAVLRQDPALDAT